MNIGIDIRPLMSPIRTGVGEYTYELLNALFKIDNQNQYFLFYNSYKDIKQNLPSWNFKNIHYIENNWPNKVFNLCQKFLVWPKIDNLIKKQFNLANLDYFFSPNLNFSALDKKTKKILTVHDLSFEIFPEFFTKKNLWWHKLINPKKQCQKTETIIAPSQNTKRDLINLYKIPEGKIKVIYPGLSSIFQEKQTQNKTLNLPDSYILFLGSIEPRKNIISIIAAYEKAFNSLPLPYSLVIAGAPGWRNKEIFKRIKKSPLKQKIFFAGYIDNNHKLEIYQRASVFIYPSFYEGFGFPVLEAMYSSVPVITSNRSSLPEITGNFAYLIDPNKPEQISKELVSILNDENIKNKLIMQAKEKTTAFSWKKTAEEFLQILK